MAKRHKERARRMRDLLIQLLGGHCKLTHTGNCDGSLEFDCIEPRGDDHHRGSTDQRMSFYWKEWKKGNIQLLCQYHNALKSRRDARKLAKKEENEPF